MKKIILMTLISMLSINSSVAATYTMKYFIDNINFKQNPEIPETWSPVAPVISEWRDQGNLYNCQEWSESENNIAIDIEFNKNRDCKQDQVRTITYYEDSNKGNKRQIGSESKELKAIDKNEQIKSYGTRYTHIMKVGSYNAWGGVDYSGYFSNSYKLSAGSNVTELSSGNIEASSYKGYTIDYFVETNGTAIEFRLLPVHDVSLNPKITIAGKVCQLVGPNIHSSYYSNCGFNLNTKKTQVIKIDIE